MADKRRYSFIEKKESKDGLLSTKLALVSLALFIVDVAVSFISGGSAGSFTGAAALTAMLLSVYGFYTGMRSFGEKDVSLLWPVIGSISSGALMLGWFALFLTGLD
ncbi:MAG: hypothetical protein IJJ38_11245 [Lachnospiraceae bacterium]|nr:hypothetical protein [Lachnospiraceae bacterium]